MCNGRVCLWIYGTFSQLAMPSVCPHNTSSYPCVCVHSESDQTWRYLSDLSDQLIPPNISNNLSLHHTMCNVEYVCEYTGRSLNSLCPLFVHITSWCVCVHSESDLLEHVPYRLHSGRHCQISAKNCEAFFSDFNHPNIICMLARNLQKVWNILLKVNDFSEISMI